VETSIKNKNAAIAFYLYFLIMNFAKGLGMSSQSRLYNIIFLASLVFLAIKLVYTRYTGMELLTMIVLVLLGVMFAVRARENTMLFAILAVIGMKDINFHDLMEKTFYVRLASIILIRLCCAYGVLQEIDGAMGPNGRILHTWGYSDANTLMVNIFIVIALFIYINYEHLKLYHAILTMLFATLGFVQSYSRTGYMLLFLLWFIILCDKMIKNKKVRNAAYFILCLMPLIIAALTFILALNYTSSSNFLEQINQMLTGRLFITNYYLKLYPFTLFGNTYEFWLNNAGEILAIVDNLYATIYIYSGVLMLVVYVGALCAVLFRISKMGCHKEIIIVSVLAIYAFMEEFPLNPVVNPFCVLIAMAVFPTNLPRGIHEHEEKGCHHNQYSISVQS
jgi:hypothetical protein